VIGVHREKVRVQLGGDVTGCHSPMSVGDDVTALTPAEKHILIRLCNFILMNRKRPILRPSGCQS